MNIGIKVTAEDLIRALRMQSHVIAETLERDTARPRRDIADDREALPVHQRRETGND